MTNKFSYPPLDISKVRKSMHTNSGGYVDSMGTRPAAVHTIKYRHIILVIEAIDITPPVYIFVFISFNKIILNRP